MLQGIQSQGRNGLYDPVQAQQEQERHTAGRSGDDGQADDEGAGEEADKKDFISRLNPDSLRVMEGFAEPVALGAETGDTFQFLRVGYFCKDRDSSPTLPVFNLVVGLKDSYRP